MARSCWSTVTSMVKVHASVGVKALVWKSLRETRLFENSPFSLQPNAHGVIIGVGFQRVDILRDIERIAPHESRRGECEVASCGEVAPEQDAVAQLAVIGPEVAVVDVGLCEIGVVIGRVESRFLDERAEVGQVVRRMDGALRPVPRNVGEGHQIGRVDDFGGFGAEGNPHERRDDVERLGRQVVFYADHREVVALAGRQAAVSVVGLVPLKK